MKTVPCIMTSFFRESSVSLARQLAIARHRRVNVGRRATAARDGYRRGKTKKGDVSKYGF